MDVNARMTIIEKTSSNPEKKGWLLKWTNYIKGYQRRWFVLSKGVLSYYRNQAEINHTCRGTISLHGALIHTVDSCTFVISNGGTQTFHIKATNEVERQSWVTALELAKAKAIRAIESEEEEEEVSAHVVPSQEINTVIRDLTERLENLRTCYDLITKHGVALQRALSDLETNEEDLASRTKIVNERATLFRITSNAMINACSDYLRTAESQGHKWSKMLQHEREQRQRLEDFVEQLAKQHTQLEQAAHQVQVLGGSGKNAQNQNLLRRNVKNANATADVLSTTTAVSICSDDDDNEFFDAEENGSFVDVRSSHDDVMKLQKQSHHSSEEQTNTSSSSENEQQHATCVIFAPAAAAVIPAATSSAAVSAVPANVSQTTIRNVVKKELPQQQLEQKSSNRSATSSKRISYQEDTVDRALAVATTIPSSSTIMKRRTSVPEKPNYPLNLWSIMKNCIGKDLSKIPMPVNFNEPLSMLQRLTEDYEYANLLDAAARTKDECEQLAYVAAFTVSAYSTTANRTGKPFNPLLGETFECDRMADLGWRCFSEQVSHHPPIAALHCEGHNWTCWQEFSMTSKFRGKYLQVIPLGSAFVQFHNSGNKYTWKKVTTVINNIIVGKLWVDQQGEAEIIGVNAAKGMRAIVKYIPYSYFSRDAQRRIKARIIDRNNEVKFVLRGAWDSRIEVAPVLETLGGDSDNPTYKTGGYRTIWQRHMPTPDSERYYNFTLLACQLNELEDGVAPTDSRLRPDQRLMEEGRWDESNQEKLRLEEKQRLKRRERESEAEAAASDGRPYPPYEPLWFKQQKDEDTGHMVHVFTGQYWEHKQRQDWTVCPNLF